MSPETEPGLKEIPVRKSLVFLIDVDNTLLNNDQILYEFGQLLYTEFGSANAARYWDIVEQLRIESGYADYFGALQRFRSDPAFSSDNAPDNASDNTHSTNNQALLRLSSFLMDYLFADRLYPYALELIAQLETIGSTVIVSDGDIAYQPRKIFRSGLWDAVGGRALVYIHKEKMLASIVQQYPGQHYVMIDDKLRVLTAMKKLMQNRLTTVFVRQGHFALDADTLAMYPPADISVACLGDLMDYKYSAFVSFDSPITVNSWPFSS
ncbi:HAD family hydrolase [Undibacterium sp. Ji50W]|uniref:HAD family hydrolase n=1 Tax=Undibacterium sp. Ji50W TaxID=3413041 RepID=UPI003BF0D909